MNSVIWKYEIGPGDIDNDHIVKKELPKGSVLLHAHAQQGNLCIWVLVPAGPQTNEVDAHSFKVLPTGIISDLTGWSYLETVHMFPDMVFHIFNRLGP
jgi:hypothetical protein